MKPKRIIIIDDDELDIRLCKIHIRHALQQTEAISFTVPEDGLNYIKSTYSTNESVPTILLLDVNMPAMSGWEFLDIFDNSDEKIKDQINVHILSSSVDSRDKDKAASNKYVKSYLVKPVTAETILKLIEE